MLTFLVSIVRRRHGGDQSLSSKADDMTRAGGQTGKREHEASK